MEEKQPYKDVINIIRHRAIQQGVALDHERLKVRGLIKLRSLYANKDYGIF